VPVLKFENPVFRIPNDFEVAVQVRDEREGLISADVKETC
jgi:hypothetical protein